MENINTPEQENQLYQARVESATKMVQQAEEELAKVITEEERILWINRLSQRRTELRRIIEENQDIAA